MMINQLSQCTNWSYPPYRVWKIQRRISVTTCTASTLKRVRLKEDFPSVTEPLAPRD